MTICIVRDRDDDDDDDVLVDGESVRTPLFLQDRVQLEDDGPRFMRMANEAKNSRRFAFDAAGHQPGYRTDDARYMQAYCRYCTDAGLPQHPDADLDATVRDARAARSRWIADMSEAWRGPQRDADLRADARRKRRDDDDDDDDARSRERRSDGADARTAARASYDAMVTRVSNAWRTPRDAAEPDNSSSAETMRRRLRGDEPDNAAARSEKAYADYKDRLGNAWRNPPGRCDPGTALAIEHRRRAYTYETGR